MRAVRFHGQKDIRLDEIPEPVCGPGQVKIRPAFVGLCGSDLHEYVAGPLITPATKPHPITGALNPVTLGHEFSGTVEEVGHGVVGVRVGDRVAIKPNIYDETCVNCRMERFNCCRNTGILGFSGIAGGLSDQAVVNAKHAIRLPENVPLDIGAMVEPLSVAWHAVDRGSPHEGDSALVVGSGPIGLAIILILQMRGVKNIFVAEVSQERQKFATQFGASHILDPAQVDVMAELRQRTGETGVDVAFECSGVQTGMDDAIACTKVRGTTVIVSMWEKKPTIDASVLVGSEKHIVGTCMYEDGNFEGVIRAICSGKLDPRPMITSVIQMEEIEEKGFKALLSERLKHVKILVRV
ncbi:chaperonin 10-like protein [Bisporella sp. PMI_857]|nr:chaperonin 10-like protein [Bisporella sp. PMI_857]